MQGYVPFCDYKIKNWNFDSRLLVDFTPKTLTISQKA